MPDDDKRESAGELQTLLKKGLAVDSRYGVLEFEPGVKYVRILTDSISIASRISRLHQKDSSDLRIKIVLIPDETVGELTKGACHVGVAPVRKNSTSTSEQVTQLLYGETFDTLQVVGTWVRVRLHSDGYLGWVSADQVSLFNNTQFNDYTAMPKVTVASHVAALLSRPLAKSAVVREAVFGCQLTSLRQSGDFLEVRVPDGTIGYVRKNECVSKPSKAGSPSSVAKLLRAAGNFMGISYAWGGRSPKGFDCSGFVQTVFRFNGVELPRDADMQFSAGKPLGRDLKRVRPGDLLFFSSNGNKITHVAIYIGKDRQFIHSSAYVRINSFDTRRRDFNQKLLSTFVGACRVI